MKNTLRNYLGIIAVIMISACNNSSTNDRTDASNTNDESTENIREIIDKKNAELEVLYNEGNSDSLATYFSDEAIQMPPNQLALTGRDKIGEMWKESMSYGQWNLSFETQEVKHSGTLAVERGKYTLNFKPNVDSPIPQMKDHGNYVVLWEKIDDDWKIVWDAPVSEMPLHPIDSVGSEQ